jgi:hypothetical protein
MNKENALKLLQHGGIVREIELGRYTLYCRDHVYIIHDNWRKRAKDRVVFTGHVQDEAISKLIDLAVVSVSITDTDRAGDGPERGL